MRSNRKLFVYAGAAIFSLLTYGFVLFATGASRPLPHPASSADAIVVLTGAERRIKTGIALLRQGYGSRLLISGINTRVSPSEVMRHNDGGAHEPQCCIDFGYDALDTIGNANEARAWAEFHHFKRLLIVTSSYHMPRSLNELALALPDVELIPYPIVPRLLREKAWWLSLSAARVLVAEYVKLVPSYVKFAVKRIWPSDVSVARHSIPTGRQRAAAFLREP